jgi:putative phosphoribosyl transferase
MHRFVDRYDAGLCLAQAVEERYSPDAFSSGVMAAGLSSLPIAGVIAARRDLPVGLLLVEPIAAPDVPDRPLGAVAEGGVVVVDARSVARTGVTDQELGALIERASIQLDRVGGQLRDDERQAWPTEPDGRMLLVSDGLVPSLSLLAAARTLRDRGSGPVVLAAPVIEHAELASLAMGIDALVSVSVSSDQAPLGGWYADARTVGVEEARTLLRGVRINL